MPQAPKKPRRKKKALLVATGSFLSAVTGCSADTHGLDGGSRSFDTGLPFDGGLIVLDVGVRDLGLVDTGLPFDTGPQVVDAGAFVPPDAGIDVGVFVPDAGVDDAEPSDVEASDGAAHD